MKLLKNLGLGLHDMTALITVLWWVSLGQQPDVHAALSLHLLSWTRGENMVEKSVGHGKDCEIAYQLLSVVKQAWLRGALI